MASLRAFRHFKVKYSAKTFSLFCLALFEIDEGIPIATTPNNSRRSLQIEHIDRRGSTDSDVIVGICIRLVLSWDYKNVKTLTRSKWLQFMFLKETYDQIEITLY